MIRALTSLRFPAALAVFVWHAPLTRAAAQTLGLGYVGVEFFFILSGFILTYAYREPFAIRDFYIARAARVLPVHYAGMLLALVTLALVGGAHWTELSTSERVAGFAAQAVLVQSWFSSPGIHFGINGPAWSLSAEAFFYAAFPAVLFALRRAFRSSAAATFVFAASLWIGGVAALVGVHARFDQWALYVLPLTRLTDFCAGVLLGLAFLQRRSAPLANATVLEAAALFAFVFGLALSAHEPLSLRFSAAMMPFCACVIFVFAFEGGAMSRALTHPLAVVLGEASYAFYVIHFSIVHLVPNFWVALFLCIGGSLCVHRYVETPLRRAIRASFLRKRAQARPPDVPAAVPAYQTP